MGEEEEKEEKKNQKDMAKMLTVEPALHSAARSGHMDIVKLILKWSTSAIFGRNSVDETPLDVAIKNKYGKIAVELCQREHYRNRFFFSLLFFFLFIIFISSHILFLFLVVCHLF